MRGGSYPRTPDPRNAAIDARQTEAFRLKVAGYSNSEIAKTLGCDRETVARDVSLEAARRAKERGKDREELISTSAAAYETMWRDTMLRIQNLRKLANETKSEKTRASYLSIIAKEGQVALKARRQMEDILGLLEVPDITINDNRGATHIHNEVKAMFAVVPAEIRAQVRERARLERMKNVTPA
jgi:transposase